MEHRNAIVALLWALWVVQAIIIARVIIPGLVNLHNDGALILAGLSGFSIPITGYLLHIFVQSLEKEDNKS